MGTAKYDILNFMLNREYGNLRCLHRSEGKVLRARVLSTSFEYRPLIHLKSQNKTIYYDQNQVYADDVTRWYTIGVNSVEELRICPTPFSVKIHSYTLVQAPMDRKCHECQRSRCCEPSIVALAISQSYGILVIQYGTHHPYGYVRHFKLHEETNWRKLSHTQLEWNDTYKSLAVKYHRVGEYNFYLFTVLPLVYCGRITLNLTAIERKAIRNMHIRLNSLIIHCDNQTVKIYNLEEIIDSCEGVDRTLIMEDLPPPLLIQYGCHRFDLQIGGHPYRLLVASAEGSYIKQLDGRSLGFIPNIDADFPSEEQEIFFSEDESGLIIQRSRHQLRAFHLPSMMKRPVPSLEPSFPVTDFMPSKAACQPTLSRSGRTINKRLTEDSIALVSPSLVTGLDLEDELDLYFTLSLEDLPAPSSPSVHMLSETLQRLKVQTLHEITDHYEDFKRLSVSGDRDLLIVSWRSRSSDYHLMIYQLTAKLKDGRSSANKLRTLHV